MRGVKCFNRDLGDLILTAFYLSRNQFVPLLTSSLSLTAPQVLQTTKASSVAAEFKIGNIFDRFYSELCQRSKLPDSGEFFFFYDMRPLGSSLAFFFCFPPQFSAKSTSCSGFWRRFIPAKWSTTPTSYTRSIWRSSKSRLCLFLFSFFLSSFLCFI